MCKDNIEGGLVRGRACARRAALSSGARQPWGAIRVATRRQRPTTWRTRPASQTGTASTLTKRPTWTRWSATGYACRPARAWRSCCLAAACGRRAR
eukprot:scaffold5182_cov111-Isochrysis_galbana.AAC.2